MGEAVIVGVAVGGSVGEGGGVNGRNLIWRSLATGVPGVLLGEALGVRACEHPTNKLVLTSSTNNFLGIIFSVAQVVIAKNK